MLTYLIRKFVKNPDATHEASMRTAYGVLAGVMGMAFNLLLFLIKLPIGLYTGSIAILSDAFNSISDMGSSLVTVTGARMALRRADDEHPFGHGRIEYLSALLVAVIILLVGLELLKESVEKFFAPGNAQVSPPLIALLSVSMLVKGYMYYYNKKLGTLVNSAVMRAAASDSINDVLVTGGVILSAILARFVDWPVDAAAGCLVSVLILISGVKVVRGTADLLLGGKPDHEMVEAIKKALLETEDVLGMHDLIVHDYGPGRAMASAHVEVPDTVNIVHMHEIIDATEHRIERELGVPIVIHADPIAVGNPAVQEAVRAVGDVVASVNPACSFHDLRLTAGEKTVNLIFDLVVPASMSPETRKRTVSAIREGVRAADARYACAIHVDNDYAD